jgi:hypothetical protein
VSSLGDEVQLDRHLTEMVALGARSSSNEDDNQLARLTCRGRCGPTRVELLLLSCSILGSGRHAACHEPLHRRTFISRHRTGSTTIVPTRLLKHGRLPGSSVISGAPDSTRMLSLPGKVVRLRERSHDAERLPSSTLRCERHPVPVLRTIGLR